MWELDLALDWLGLTDEQKQTVITALPIANKFVGHVVDNKKLFATLWADGELLIPAAKIVLDALTAKGLLKGVES